MKKIGVTGGIGSGKSIICEAFSIFDIPYYNADNRAKVLIMNDMIIKEGIISLLGDEAYLQNGNYNKKYVASKVFSNPSLLTQLNDIIHPKVKIDAISWFKANEHKPYVLYEAAIMNKAKDNNQLDYVIAVIADEQTRKERILLRDPFRNEKDIKAIFENQQPQHYFESIANFIIVNNNESLILDKVIELDSIFRK